MSHIEVTTATATAPSYWASYLVNGDASGLDPAEKVHAEHWLALRAPWRVVDVARDDDGEAIEARFTWHYGLYDTLADCSGGDVLDYVMHKVS